MSTPHFVGQILQIIHGQLTQVGRCFDPVKQGAAGG